MKALVFDGERAGESSLKGIRRVLEERLDSAGWEHETLDLRDLDIAPCTGCFRCWTKTPGICVIDDVAREVTKKVVRADLLVILTPVTFGGYSSEVKKALDRSLGFLLPYFTTIKGHIHHARRYARYPDLLAIGTAPRRDKGLEAIFRDLVHRNSLNSHSRRQLAGVIEEGADPEVVIDRVSEMLFAMGVPV